MYRLAIFDLDGTLLDTIKDLSTACNVALDAHGYTGHDLEAYKTYVGNGIYKLVERALPEDARDEVSVLKVKATFDAYYSEHSEDYTKPYTGILALLNKLKESGIICCVLTNKAHDYALGLVERQFGNLVAKTLGQREGIPTKPDPIGIHELMEAYNVSKEAVIYIGDSDVDMFTGKAADVTTVGVSWGFRSEEELIDSGAHYIVHTPEALQEIICKA